MPQPLYEQSRPRTFSEVVGQDQAVRRIEVLRRRGLAGRAGVVGVQKLAQAVGRTDVRTVTAKSCGPAGASCRQVREPAPRIVNAAIGREDVADEAVGGSWSPLQNCLGHSERQCNRIADQVRAPPRAQLPWAKRGDDYDSR